MSTWVLLIFWWGDFAASTSSIPNLTEKECYSLKTQIYPPVGKMSISCVNKGE